MKKALFISLIIFGACKSTETINIFAKSANAATSQVALASLCATVPTPFVHCPEFQRTDTLTDLISQTLINYFSMLAAVSDKQLIDYNANHLLKKTETIQTQVDPSLVLSEEKMSAIRSLLNIILNEPIKWYRYNKLVHTMKTSDSLLGRVIESYRYILDSAQNGEINQAIEKDTSFVYAPLYSGLGSSIEKGFVNQQYKQFMNTMSKKREQIHKASSILTLIRKDHYLLAFGKPPVGFAYTDAEIGQDIILLNKMITELIQLNK